MAWEPDISKFPDDKVTLPARLENMRPGQIRSAVAEGAPCIVPVGVMEAIADDVPLGMDRVHGEDRLMAMAKQMNAVVAPTIWYAPTGYINSGPSDGTFSLCGDDFSQYVKEVLAALHEVGFAPVIIVPVNNPQGKNSPLMSACRFAVGELFNEVWKDPELGENWYIRPDMDKLPWGDRRFRILDLPAESKKEMTPGQKQMLPHPFMKRPLKLEQMTPKEVKRALAMGLPCFVPVGVLETHGNQNPIGVDSIQVQDPLILAAEKEWAVIAPTVWYGPTARACGNPKLGNLDISGQVFEKHMEGIVNGLAAMGFKNIGFWSMHQGGGAHPTGIEQAIARYHSDLALRPEYGPGWAKRLKPSEMKHSNVEQINIGGGGYDHAGKYETSWMLYLRPQNTRLSLLRKGDYNYCWSPNDESKDATYERGKEMCEKVVGNAILLFREKRAKVTGR